MSLNQRPKSIAVSIQSKRSKKERSETASVYKDTILDIVNKLDEKQLEKLTQDLNTELAQEALPPA